MRGIIMENDTFARIERILRETPSLPPEKRAELIGLLANLRREIESLDPSHAEAARNIAEQAQALASHALTPGRDRESLGRPLSDLSNSVQGFEQSHPRLVYAANTICNALSNMGI
jgi:hypothetical protein